MRHTIILVSVMCFFNKCLNEDKFVSRYLLKMDYEKENMYKEKKPPNYLSFKEFVERHSGKKNDGNGAPKVSLEAWNSESLSGGTLSTTHGYDLEKDKGWVTLEVVPWSISKVSKWESKHKSTSDIDWSKTEQHLTNSYKYSNDDPKIDRTSLTNPLQGHDISTNKNSKRPWNKYAEINTSKDICSKEEIITDSLPPNFPAVTDFNKRYISSEISSTTYPSYRDGEWVLLSATKGYKYQKGWQKSLEIPNNTHNTSWIGQSVISSSKNSNENKSVSSGGLLNAESLQNVNQVKGFVKNVTAKELKNGVVSRKSKSELHKRVISAVRPRNNLDSSAVIAAVSAGMIPATMAMLVPIAMGGKLKRSTRLNVN